MTRSQSLLIALMACGLTTWTACGLGDGDGDSDRDGDEDSDTDSDSRSGPDAPLFLDFSVNTSEMTDVDTVTFTAVLTDPDGIEDLIGGTLKSPEGASYGSFQTAAEEGSYVINLRWSDINTVQRIDLEGGDDARTFVAVFFDADGNSATRDVVVQLACEGFASTCNGDGLCAPLDSEEDCLVCGNDCDTARPTTQFGGDIHRVSDNIGITTWGCDLDVEPIGCWGFFSLNRPIVDNPQVTCNDICGDWTCDSAQASFGDTPVCSSNQVYNGQPRELKCVCVQPDPR